MKLAYFDCFSGISGDMTLGALVDAGCPVEHLRSELAALKVPGWALSGEKVWKNGMAATYVKVKTEDQQKHRSLSAILEILKNSQLATPVRERASAIFTKLGEAEARRSEEHTSELQSRRDLVCRLLLEKKKKNQ